MYLILYNVFRKQRFGYFWHKKHVYMLDRKGIVKEDIMKKRLLVILLSVAVLFTFTPTIALAETESSVRGSGEEEVIATPATTGRAVA